jgi:hypothetical protein
MFLYYFDNEMGEAPRGVIDLELFDNVIRESEVTIKLTAGVDDSM